LIDSDLASHLLAVAEGRLEGEQISFLDCHCLTVVLATKGYPFSPEKGGVISLPSSREGNSQNELAAWVNHAGTSLQGGELIATGGRVLSATGMGRNLKQAAQAAYRLMERIELAESQYRLDIGWRALWTAPTRTWLLIKEISSIRRTAPYLGMWLNSNH
jgi:phosphoribosylamine--glycine ligase